MQVDLSIIIPAYNCQDTIDRALKSILKTKKIKYEIIIINDFSTDNTITILQKYQRLQNIKIVNLKENKGVSYCRNLGIDIASGNYIAFLDSDDFINDGMYERLFHEAKNNNLDICVCGHLIVNPNNDIKQISKYNTYGNFNSNEMIRLLLLDKVSPAIFDKIFKKEGLQKYNENLKVGEDFLFCLENFFYCKKAAIIPENYYNYVQNDNSTMHKFNKNLEQICCLDKYIKCDILSFLNQHYAKEFEFFKLRNITRYINSISNISNDENKKEIKKAIKKYLNKQTILKIIKNKEMNKFIRLEFINILIFGINFHLFMMPVYKKIKRKKMSVHIKNSKKIEK